MNRKQFVILLVLVVVIGAAGLMIRQRNQSSWQSGGASIGQKLLPNFALNDVAQITIKSGTNELDLAKHDNLWRVRQRADYPANFSQIRELLVKLADMKVVQTEEAGPSQLGRLELSPDKATAVEFKDQAGKTLGSLLLGKKHMAKPPKNPQFSGMGDEGWPDGRYVFAGANTKTVAVISDPLDSMQTKADQWLNKDFLSIEKPRSIAVQFPDATNSWKLTRASETNDWQLADAKPDEKSDSSKISSVTSPFSSGSFNDVTAASGFNPSNPTSLTVETFDGFTYAAKIGAQHDDSRPVLFSVKATLGTNQTAKLTEKLAKEQAFTNWVYELPSYSVDEILKPRHELLAEASTNSATATQK